MNDIPTKEKIKVLAILGKLKDCNIAEIQLCECYIRFITVEGKQFELDINFINAYLDLFNYEKGEAVIVGG